MTIHAINVRLKGQMTLPAEVLEDLGVKDGGKVLLEQRGGEWVLVRPDDMVDRLAGSLSEFAANEPLEWNRGELWSEIENERDDRIVQQVRREDRE